MNQSFAGLGNRQIPEPAPNPTRSLQGWIHGVLENTSEGKTVRSPLVPLIACAFV
jgi:hypothetical protein